MSDRILDIKTIKTYISIIRKIELVSPTLLKGFDKLSNKEKELIEILDAEISNNINEVSYKDKNNDDSR